MRKAEAGKRYLRRPDEGAGDIEAEVMVMPR